MLFSRKVNQSPRAALLPIAFLALLIICGLSVGCGKKDAEATTATTGTAKGQPTVVSTPNPEQEAAKQRAIQQGPGIEAANEAAARAANDARAAGK